jgi:hypothetical protein
MWCNKKLALIKSADDYTECLKEVLTVLSSDWNVEHYKELIKKTNAKIEYNVNNTLYVDVHDYKSLCKIYTNNYETSVDNAKWCIVREEELFDYYIEDNNKIIMILNFNLPINDPNRIIGCQVKPITNQIITSHDYNDKQIEKYINEYVKGYTAEEKNIKVYTIGEWLDEKYSLEQQNELGNIKCESNNIISLNGIEKCPNLLSLNCNNNYLTDLKGIENCKKIIYLKINYNNIKSLNELEKCTNLTFVEMSDNNISSLRGFDYHIKLKTLNCENNNIISLKELKKCINLQKLNCGKNNLTTLEGLNDCINLQEINCAYNNIKTLKGIEKCKKIHTLYFGKNVDISYKNEFEVIQKIRNGEELD